MMSDFITINLSKGTTHLDAILSGITHIHASCIEHDQTLATFLPPLEYSKMLKYWQDRLGEVVHGSRHIWVELHPIASRNTQHESSFKDNKLMPIVLEQHPNHPFEVGGVVVLNKPFSETGSFRGEVEKLLVSPNHRQKGIARRLMTELERVALEEGRWSLTLGTIVGSPAEKIYPRLGYVTIGIVPENGISPNKGELCDEMFFYKKLSRL